MPSYNCSKFIKKTIESIQCQSYTNWELIIVDDKSTDNSVEKIKELKGDDSRIKLYCQPQNKGAAQARTKAIELAQGDYIAFLDSDDLWLPNKLEKQLEFMQKHNYLFSCTKYQEISEDEQSMGDIIKVLPKSNYNQVLKTCPIGNSTVMYNAKELGTFEVPDIKRNNDFALWLTILKKTEAIYGLDEVLTYYRLSNNSISRNKFKMVKYHWKLFREVENIGVVKSTYLLVYWIIIKLVGTKKQRNMAYLFYKKVGNISCLEPKNINDLYCCKILRPKCNNMHSILWTLFSLGRFKEYQLIDKKTGIIASKSQVMPYIFIFAFMKKRKSLHIGPCETDIKYRGQGLYPYLLKRIMFDYRHKIDMYYIFCYKTNQASINGITKAGFGLFAKGHKSKMGIYVVDENIS